MRIMAETWAFIIEFRVCLQTAPTVAIGFELAFRALRSLHLYNLRDVQIILDLCMDAHCMLC